MTDVRPARPVTHFDPLPTDEGDVSVLSLVAALVRKRGRIFVWMVGGGLIALLPVIAQRHQFKATGAFLPQGSQAGAASGLASLAGQFGISLQSGNVSQSPDFYVELLRSRPLLRALVHDTVTIGGQRTAMLDVLNISAADPRVREERGIIALSKVTGVSFSKSTSIVHLQAMSRYPEVAFHLVQRMIDETNAFNQRTRQTQAAAEAKFLQRRLKLAEDSLRAAEDRLQAFYQSNREIESSPQLRFNRDRLQREVNMTQSVFTSLSQGYEEASVREVRDTPVISLIESPTMPVTPEPLGRVGRTMTGVVAGGLFGAFITIWSTIFARRRANRDPEVDDMLTAMADLRRSFTRWLPWRRRRVVGE